LKLGQLQTLAPLQWLEQLLRRNAFEQDRAASEQVHAGRFLRAFGGFVEKVHALDDLLFGAGLQAGCA